MFWRGLRGDAPSMLPLIWILGTSFGNILLLMLVTALGINLTLELLVSIPRLRLYLAGMIVVSAALLQTDYYFGFHISRFHVRYRDLEDAIWRASSVPAGTQIHIVMEHKWNAAFNQHLLDFFADGLRITTYYQWDVDVTTFVPDIPTAFLLLPDDETTIQFIEQWTPPLPPPQFSLNPDVPREKQYAFYFLAGDAERMQKNIVPKNQRQQDELGRIFVGLVMVIGAFGVCRVVRWSA